MDFATAADGTRIAFRCSGRGERLILVTGGLDDGAENEPLAAELAHDFTVVNYQRRGRGLSGDIQPYAVEREIEDVQALMGEGANHLFGVSSGGALALEAAAAGLPFAKVAVYEVPYLMDEGIRQGWLSYVDELRQALDQERRGDALKLFMRLAGSSDEQVAAAEDSEHWQPLLRIAHTLAYDAACLRDGRPPATFAQIAQPVLVAIGTHDWMGDFYASAADAIASAVPDARRGTLAGQGHVAGPRALAAALTRFFKS
jgi:pimeloyl-ACP methyl ester carboxylesterase